MKKLLLSISVIAAFLIYSVVKNHDSNEVSEHPVVINTTVISPSLVIATPTPTAAPSDGTPQNPTSTPDPTPTSAMMLGKMMGRGQYKDGSYTGDVADAFYGNIQVQAVVSGGKLTDVIFLQYPNDRNTSIEINTQAMPMLKSEALTAQSANVDGVSGATDSSRAFIQSLGSALAKAS